MKSVLSLSVGGGVFACLHGIAVQAAVPPNIVIILDDVSISSIATGIRKCPKQSRNGRFSGNPWIPSNPVVLARIQCN